MLLRHPAGLSLMQLQLQEEIRGSVGRRTLSRRISALLAAGRIHGRGGAKATRYLYGPAPTTQERPQVEREGRPSAADIRALAARVVEPRDVPKFVAMVSQEFRRLTEFNIARYRLRLSEYRAWFRALEGANAAP